eukprot:5837541-Prymnesium_polylepis.1
MKSTAFTLLCVGWSHATNSPPPPASPPIGDVSTLAAAKEALNTPYSSVYFPAAFSTKPPSH